MFKVCDLYNRQCIQCGDCEMCDLDKARKCDNCGKCIDESGDYRTLNIDEFLTKEDKKKMKKS